MATKTFVYPELEEHKPYRSITRDTPLTDYGPTYLEFCPKNVDPRVALGEHYADMSLDEIKWIPKNPKKRHQFIDDWFIGENGGVNLCSGDIIVREISHGGFRLSGHCRDYSGPTALEIIAWGVGVFRKTKTEQETSYAKATDADPMPKVVSEHLRVLQHHLVPIEDLEVDEQGNYIDEEAMRIDIYESTNLILADSYGELEQLKRRSREKEFLHKYLTVLQNTAEFVQRGSGGVARGMIQFYPPIAEAWVNHIKNGIWKEPPKSIRELSDRVKFLLENTQIDNNPRMEITNHKRHTPLIH